MIPTAIKLIFLTIILSSLVSAADLELISPEKVNVGEEFFVEIIYDSNKLHDVKIFIHENDKIISQIYTNSWDNPFYYILSSFPEQTSFSIKALTESRSASLCVRLRESGKTTYIEECKLIVVSNQETKTIQQETSSGEKIILNSPPNKETIRTKHWYIQNGIIILVPLFCLFFLLLIALKILK